MNKKEVEELTYIILKDQNFDFKSYPNLWVYYYYEVLHIIQNSGTFNFNVTFDTKNLDLNYEIIQVMTNYFLKLLKIYNLKKGREINFHEYNSEERQNLIDQYYLEMFGEENKIIQSRYLFGYTFWLCTNNLSIWTQPPLLETQLEECIKLLRSYEQWIEKKLKN